MADGLWQGLRELVRESFLVLSRHFKSQTVENLEQLGGLDMDGSEFCGNEKGGSGDEVLVLFEETSVPRSFMISVQ